MSTYLITGASSGLGLQVALLLARQKARLILPIRNIEAGETLRKTLRDAGAADVSTPFLDLAALQGVAKFLNAFRSRPETGIDGLLLNAGVQSANRIEFTADGIERTFAVNHLAHHFILRELLSHLSDRALVGWTTSGTHDPKETLARRAGFRGGRYTTAEKLAKGEFGPDIPVAQACKDAYATSKLCNIVSARAFARARPDVTFFSFDPGMMPGTGLARDHAGAARWIWHNVLPRLAPLLPGTSSPEKSAVLLTNLLTGRLAVSPNGAYFRYTGKPVEPAPPATERRVADDLMRFSDSLLGSFMPALAA